MAKKKSVIKSIVNKGKRALRSAAKMVPKALDMLDAKAVAAAKMLEDPCNATLSEACYRGDQGYRNRFVASAVYGGGAGQNALAVVYSPTANAYYFSTTVGSGVTGTWTTVSGPGASFVGSNASGIRSLGACLQATPNAANLSTSGQVYTAVVSTASIGLLSGTSPSCDSLAQLCNKYGKINIDAPMETKWIPASSDEDFQPPNVLPTDATDSNIILMVFIGFPAASGITLRFTNIIEWKPLANLGIATESFLGNPSRNTIEHVKQALRSKDPNWWSNVGKGAYSVLRGYATGGTMGAFGAAMRATKFL